MSAKGSIMSMYYAVRKMENDGITGFSQDLRKRFSEHNEGKSAYTKGRGPFELIYYEAYKHKEDARSREKQLKSGQGKAYLQARIKCFLTLSG